MSIYFTPTGWQAVYDTDDGGIRYLDVEAWDPDTNKALVVSYETLSSADGVKGFRNLQQVSRIVSVIPAAPGWRLQIDEGEEAFTVPIAAWIADDLGCTPWVAATIRTSNQLLDASTAR